MTALRDFRINRFRWPPRDRRPATDLVRHLATLRCAEPYGFLDGRWAEVPGTLVTVGTGHWLMKCLALNLKKLRCFVGLSIPPLIWIRSSWIRRPTHFHQFKSATPSFSVPSTHVSHSPEGYIYLFRGGWRRLSSIHWPMLSVIDLEIYWLRRLRIEGVLKTVLIIFNIYT